MNESYDQKFFEWVNFTARRSAQHLIPVLLDHLRPKSVLDVGCGQGTWLAAWRELGVADVIGVDGNYVARNALSIPAERFIAHDLSQSWRLDRRFGLVQSLEVAEHLRPASSACFVESLCAHGNVILFSAAQPGQGGEGHVNERKLSWWAGEFAARGYAAFDFLRPQIAHDRSIDPWYRYNTVVFANSDGERELSPTARSSRVDDFPSLDRAGNLSWKVRRALLRPWPPAVVTLLSRLRYRLVMMLVNARNSQP